MIPRDTTPAAAAVQAGLYRRMPLGRTAALAVQLSLDLRRITLAGIRQRHPEYGDREATFALFRLLVGDDLFRRAWPGAPVLPP